MEKLAHEANCVTQLCSHH